MQQNGNVNIKKDYIFDKDKYSQKMKVNKRKKYIAITLAVTVFVGYYIIEAMDNLERMIVK